MTDRGETTRSILTSLYVQPWSVEKLPEWLRAWVTIAALTAGACFVICTVLAGILLIHLGWNAVWEAPPGNQEVIKNFLLAFASTFGIPFLIWRTWVAHQQATAASEQARVAVENHITGIFSKSVELMGFVRESKTTGANGVLLTRLVPNIESRLGALYSLERLLAESIKDQRAILETLCAYIRENSPLEIPEDEADAQQFFRGDLPPAPTRRADVQAAITIIGRRPSIVRDRAAIENWRLDLRSANLVGYSFSQLIFDRTDFDNSFLNAAKLAGGNFEMCSLKQTFLRSADLTGASFRRSKLENCDMKGSRIENTDFREATLTDVDLRKANVVSVDIRGANLEKAFSSALDYFLKRAKENEVAPYEAMEFGSLAQLFKKATADENTSVSQTVRDILIMMK